MTPKEKPNDIEDVRDDIDWGNLTSHEGEEIIKSYLISQRKLWYAKGRKMKGSSWREGYEEGLNLRKAYNDPELLEKIRKQEQKRILGVVEEMIRHCKLGLKTKVVNESSYRGSLDTLSVLEQRISKEEWE